MKIRKHGSEYDKTLKKDNSEKFDCDNCGCEFTAKQDEYYVDCGGADYGTYTNINLNYTISSVIRDYYVCSCPECHKIVKKVHERKSSYTYATATATSTSSDSLINSCISDPII